MKKTGVYITLYHGRKPGQELDDWGIKGPTFGPFEYIQTTYASHIKFGYNKDGELLELHVVDDMIYYDGIFYGDWEITTADKVNINYLQVLEPEKAKVTDEVLKIIEKG